jgi:hypothetical protein
VRRFGQVLIFVLASSGWMACTEGDSPHLAEDAGELPSEVQVLVGKAGGTVKAKGVSLEIPEGALDKDVMIHAKVSDDVGDLPSKVKRESDLVEFGPAGTKFNKDVTVTFALNKQEPRAVVYFTKEKSEDEFEPLPSSKSQGREVTALVKHFSRGFAGVAEEEEDEPEAGVDDDAGSDADAGLDAGTDTESDAQLDAGDPDAGSVDAGARDAGEPNDGADDGPSDAGPQLRTITLRSHDVYGVASDQTWVAYQDGAGAWQTVAAGATGQYKFQIASDRYTVVAVCANANNTQSSGTLLYALASTTTPEVVAMGYCNTQPAPALYQLTGSIDYPDGGSRLFYGHNLSEGDSPIIYNDAGVPTYAIAGVRANEPFDAVLAVANSDGMFIRSRVLRGLSVTGDTTLNLDLQTLGGPTDAAEFTVTNATVDTSMSAYFTTANAATGLDLAQAGAWGEDTRHLDIAIMPQSEVIAADRYRLHAEETVPGQTFREANLVTTAPAGASFPFPAAFAPTFNAVTTPYLRPSVRFESVPDAIEYALNFQYLNIPQVRLFTARIESGYLLTGGSNDFVYPDLSGIQGFNSAWVPPATASVSVNANYKVLRSVSGGELYQFSETSSSYPPP